MKRFVFGLQAVLSHRERVEDEKQLVLAARQRELRVAEEELARLNEQFRRYTAQLRDGHKDFGADDLKAYYAHLEYLDRAITMQHATIASRRLAMEQARTVLVGASKERKVIEKLKDKRLTEHRAVEAHQEQKELDDSNNRRYTGSTW